MLIDSVPRITIANERSRSRSDRTNEKCCYPIGILMLLIACKLWCTDKIVKSAKLSDRSFQSINQNLRLSVESWEGSFPRHYSSWLACIVFYNFRCRHPLWQGFPRRLWLIVIDHCQTASPSGMQEKENINRLQKNPHRGWGILLRFVDRLNRSTGIGWTD